MVPRRLWFSVTVVVSLLATLRVGTAQAQPPADAFIARAEQALAEQRPGSAILNLERARLLSPRSRLVADDLVRARRAANLPTTEPHVTGTSSQLLRTDQWDEVALAGLALAGAAAIAALARLGRRAFRIIALVGGFVATVGFWGAVRAEPPPNLAVVIYPGLVARSAPSSEALAVFVPAEGSLVSVERSDGRFVLISRDGRRGWVPSAGVETILPET